MKGEAEQLMSCEFIYKPNWPIDTRQSISPSSDPT